ncbi:MAG: hypothetical protein KGY67_00635 [Candidatus Thermoplasmatota archaeon]|nr:hypothetical protein [Candidatus Thermoplasmatota archaeon]
MKGQLKKTLYNKKLVDTPDGEPTAEWRLSPWKVFFLLLALLTVFTIIYAYLATPNPTNFLGNIIFYVIVLLSAIAILWISSHAVFRARKIISGFIIAFILIITFYWFLGCIISNYLPLNFHMGGYSLWILITILAGLGAKRIDGSLDRNDVGYGLLVFIVCIGANIPVANGQGFLWNLDNLIYQLLGYSDAFTSIIGIIL